MLAEDTSRTHSSLNTPTDSLTPFHVRHSIHCQITVTTVSVVTVSSIVTPFDRTSTVHFVFRFDIVTTSCVVTPLGIATTFDA